MTGPTGRAWEPPVVRVRWNPVYRLVPSRFPPVSLFERIADPADWDDIVAIESLTNSRLRDEAGEISLVPPDERVSGPGASYLMAPFTHLSGGGRFSTSRFGAWYGAHDLETAIRETVHHRERFLAATRQRPMEIDMRELRARLDGRLHDVRGAAASHAPIYDRDDYTASQALATRLRGAGGRGIVYDSVRHAAGQCVGAWTPKLLHRCRQAAHYCYVWDGTRITDVYAKSGLRQL